MVCENHIPLIGQLARIGTLSPSVQSYNLGYQAQSIRYVPRESMTQQVYMPLTQREYQTSALPPIADPATQSYRVQISEPMRFTRRQSGDPVGLNIASTTPMRIMPQASIPAYTPQGLDNGPQHYGLIVPVEENIINNDLLAKVRSQLQLMEDTQCVK